MQPACSFVGWLEISKIKEKYVMTSSIICLDGWETDRARKRGQCRALDSFVMNIEIQ